MTGFKVTGICLQLNDQLEYNQSVLSTFRHAIFDYSFFNNLRMAGSLSLHKVSLWSHPWNGSGGNNFCGSRSTLKKLEANLEAFNFLRSRKWKHFS